MRRILVCFILFTNVIDIASPVSYSIEGAYKSFQYITENCKPDKADEWSKKVTINDDDINDINDDTEKSEKTRSMMGPEADSTSERPPDELTTPASTGGVLSWIKKMAAYVVGIPLQKTKEKLKTIRKTLSKKVRGKIKNLCASIPEPIGMPDVNLSKVKVTFQAYNGSISGFRRLCERHANFPLELKRDGLRFGVKYQLPMHGLHFHYHVIDERLGVDRTFNWTLGRGSAGEINFMIGFSFPCVLTMEDIDLRLDFDGSNGRGKCLGDCNSILGRMKCYFYYGIMQTFGLLSEPLKYVLSSFACVSFKRMGLQEVST